MANVVLIIAGGSGNRMHQDIPKQFLTVDERPVIVYTLEAFEHHPEIDAIGVSCLEGWERVLWAYAKQFNITKLKYVVQGGDTGYKSIQNGIFELEKHFDAKDMILIHDAIRPMVSPEVISDAIRVATLYGNATPVFGYSEAMLETQDGITASGALNKANVRRAQAPQAYRLGELCDLHRRAIAAGITNSETSCTLLLELGGQVYFSAGSEKNIKLTTIEDIDIFKALLKTERSSWLKN